jgi:hypothetical protein
VSGILVRIGNVLYWAGSAVAAILLVVCIAIMVAYAGGFGFQMLSDALAVGGFCAVIALLSWLAGRAAKYILAGT